MIIESLVAKVKLLIHCLAISPILKDFPVVSLKRISLKDEDIVVKKLALTQDWHQGLGGGGRAGISPVAGYYEHDHWLLL